MQVRQHLLLATLLLPLGRGVPQEVPKDFAPASVPNKRGWRPPEKEAQDLKMSVSERERWRDAVGVMEYGRHAFRDNSSYLIVAPTIARPDSVYQFLVGILKGEVPVSVRASLSSVTGHDMGQAEEVIHPGEMRTLMIMLSQKTMASVGEDGALLKVEGRDKTKLLFRNTTHVATPSRYLTVLIDMSRPHYNGNEKIQFRVLLLKRDLLPYDGPVDVFALDPEGYVMRRWVSRFPKIGVIQLGFTTPALPRLGWWRIRVVAGGQIEEQPFFVKKVFPSRYEANVEMPFYTLVSSGSVRGQFAGIQKTLMPLHGNATVVLYKRTPLGAPESAFVEVSRMDYHVISGYHNFSFPLDLLKDSKATDLRQVEAMVKVNLCNTFDGAKYSGHAITRFVSEEVKLEFVGSDHFVFKPGMPFSGTVTVRQDDLSPVERERLEGSHLVVTPSATLSTGATTTLPRITVKPKESVVSVPLSRRQLWAYGNASEEVYFPQLEDYIRVESVREYRERGILRFTIDVPVEATSMHLSATYTDGQGSTSTSVSGIRPHSSRNRFLQVTSSTVTANVGEFAVFHVRANFRLDKFQYVVMAKGVMVYSATEEVPNPGTDVVWTLSVTVAREMCPRFTLTVIHVAADGEVLTDSVHMAVNLQSLEASLYLNQHKDHSKRTVEAMMLAPSGGHMAVSCVRRETFQMNSESRVSQARFLREALIMEPHPRSVHHTRMRSREGLWPERFETVSTMNTAPSVLSSLHFSGLSLSTDAFLDSPLGTGHCDVSLGYLECGDGSCYRQAEVCDGEEHCLNGADEQNCLTLDRRLQEDSSGRLIMPQTPEQREEMYRLSQRSYWRTIFDMAKGDWCYFRQSFGHKEFERADLTVPNLLGNWVMEAFVVHPELGFAVLPEQRYESKPAIFMAVEAPSICRRGEQISIRAHLHNSSPQKIMVMLILKGSPHYRFVHVEEGGKVSHHNPRLSSGDHQHLITVDPDAWTQVMLPLAILKQSGTFQVTLKALSQVGSDLRSVKVKVQPEGAGVRKHTSVLLDLKSRATVYEFMDLPMDESPEISKSLFRRYVYGSPKAKVTLSGDVFGPTSQDMTLSFTSAFMGRILKSTDGLAFNFGTTTWTLHYLRLTNQLSMKKARKAFEFLNVQLAGMFLRYRDGAFGMWSAANPSLWVTTRVVNVLLAAQHEDWENLIYIEPRLISKAVNFILKHQREDGSFVEPYVTLDHKMSFRGKSLFRDDEKSSVALTALVVTVLYEASATLDAEVHTQAHIAREKAIRFLERSLSHMWDPYELATSTYALTLVNSLNKATAIKMLERHAREADGKIHWSRKAIASNVRRAEDNQHSFLLPKEPQEWDSHAVEATSYALMAFLINEGVTPRQEAIVRWLTSVRDWTCAFSSTVDTVVALRALAEYSYRARLRDVTALRVRMTATSSPGTRNNISIGREELSLMRSLSIAKPWGHVRLVAEGAGQAIAQLEVSWGVDLVQYLKKPARKYFELEVKESFPDFRNKTVVRVTACARWVAEDVSSTSHAAMLEIEIPTGYSLYQPRANAVVTKSRHNFPELADAKMTASRSFWQFESIPSHEMRCFNYSVRRRHPVANLTVVRSATIFELFAPEHFETVVINSTSLAALDICEVCGSYQCPYCPFYSGNAPNLPCLSVAVMALLTTVISLQGHYFLGLSLG